MRNLTRNMRVLVGTMAVVAALGAVLASTAAAEVVVAKPSSASFKLSTPSAVTLKRGGAEAKSCTLSPGPVSTTGFGYLANGPYGEAFLKCSEGNFLKFYWRYMTYYDTVANRYFITMENWPNGSGVSYGPTPWGGQLTQYVSTGPAQGTWTNGSGATMSKVTFSERQIGTVEGKSVTLTGSFTATTLSNTLVTLSK